MADLSEQPRSAPDAEVRLRAILAGLLDPVVAVDAQGIVQEASASVRSVFGWEPGEWIGRKLERYLPAGRVELLDGTHEVEVARKDGTSLACELSLARVEVPGASGPLFIGSFRDVTARKAAQAREAQMLKALEAIGESASVLVHDIKNPVTGIQLAVQAVADQLGVDSREILQGLEESLRKLERTMRRTLSFAKPLQPRRQALVPARLLETVARRARTELAHPAARVEIECARDLPPLAADEALLEEALWNLVQNSFEALASGGRVKLGARRAADGALELSVEDDGPGIPGHVLPNLFRPFTTTKAQGTGLGLALCRKIVEAHGGEIRADRGALGGAGFTIRLRPSP